MGLAYALKLYPFRITFTVVVDPAFRPEPDVGGIVKGGGRATGGVGRTGDSLNRPEDGEPDGGVGRVGSGFPVPNVGGDEQVVFCCERCLAAVLELYVAGSLQDDDPFVGRLIIPSGRRRGVALGNDTLDAHSVPAEDLLDILLEQVFRQSGEQVPVGMLG